MGAGAAPPPPLFQSKPQVRAWSSKALAAVVSNHLLAATKHLMSALRPGWRGHKLVMAAFCLLAVGTALPALWQKTVQQGPGTEATTQAPGESALTAPDLSTLEPFAPLPPVMTSTELAIAAEDDSYQGGDTIVVATAEDIPEMIAPADNDHRIPELLELGRQSLDDYRLSTPPKHNANHYFEQILEIDPNHSEARRGYEQIAVRYSELAETALGRGNRNQADRYVKLGLGFDPDNAELLRQRQNVVAKATPESAPESGGTSFLSGFKRLLTEDLPAASSGEQADLGMETTNR
jgi:hypothetical protein